MGNKKYDACEYFNITINQQIYKYFKKYFIILKSMERYVFESTEQWDVRWHTPSCVRSPHHNTQYDKQTTKIERPRPSHAAFAEISNCYAPKDQVSAAAKVTVYQGEYDLSSAEIKTARLMQQQGLPEIASTFPRKPHQRRQETLILLEGLSKNDEREERSVHRNNYVLNSALPWNKPSRGNYTMMVLV